GEARPQSRRLFSLFISPRRDSSQRNLRLAVDVERLYFTGICVVRRLPEAWPAVQDDQEALAPSIQRLAHAVDDDLALAIFHVPGVLSIPEKDRIAIVAHRNRHHRVFGGLEIVGAGRPALGIAP